MNAVSVENVKAPLLYSKKVIMTIKPGKNIINSADTHYWVK